MATSTAPAIPARSSVKVRCTGCSATLLRVVPGPLGTRVMRCFGTRVAGSDRLPNVAHLVCDACAAITTIPRNVVPGPRIPRTVHARLSSGEIARVVMGTVDEPPAPGPLR